MNVSKLQKDSLTHECCVREKIKHAELRLRLSLPIEKHGHHHDDRYSETSCKCREENVEQCLTSLANIVLALFVKVLTLLAHF